MVSEEDRFNENSILCIKMKCRAQNIVLTSYKERDTPHKAQNNTRVQETAECAKLKVNSHCAVTKEKHEMIP